MYNNNMNQQANSNNGVYSPICNNPAERQRLMFEDANTGTGISNPKYYEYQQPDFHIDEPIQKMNKYEIYLKDRDAAENYIISIEDNENKKHLMEFENVIKHVTNLTTDNIKFILSISPAMYIRLLDIEEILCSNKIDESDEHIINTKTLDFYFDMNKYFYDKNLISSFSDYKKIHTYLLDNISRNILIGYYNQSVISVFNELITNNSREILPYLEAGFTNATEFDKLLKSRLNISRSYAPMFNNF